MKIFALLLLITTPALAQSAFDDAAKDGRAVLAELIAADTTSPPGNEARAVTILAKSLKDADVPYEISEFAPGRQNIVARLKGSGARKPLLLIAHLDVVGADPKTWSSNPHELVEKDGFLQGRGVSDDLGMAVAELEVFLLLKKEGLALDRDVILALTGDEESDGGGVRWLLENKPDSIRAESALNEGGGVMLDDTGNVKSLELQLAEKMYVDFELVAHGPGGHSSVPLKGNSIYRLAAALDRIGKHEDPPRLIPVTRAYFGADAALEKPEMAAAMRELGKAGKALPKAALKTVESDPAFAANLRTTCVATTIQGGIRVNALPERTAATLNCRVLPDETLKDVQARLEKLIADPGIEVHIVSHGRPSLTSPLEGEVPEAVKKIGAKFWPNAPVIPFMSRAATDSAFLRGAGISAYGLHPMAMTQADQHRAHGADERLPAASVRSGVEFLHALVVELAAKK
jgi:acetylornithine deacetylase/succinyl-diaminopimelate desuccinylase-like protein